MQSSGQAETNVTHATRTVRQLHGQAHSSLEAEEGRHCRPDLVQVSSIHQRSRCSNDQQQRLDGSRSSTRSSSPLGRRLWSLLASWKRFARAYSRATHPRFIQGSACMALNQRSGSTVVKCIHSGAWSVIRAVPGVGLGTWESADGAHSDLCCASTRIQCTVRLQYNCVRSTPVRSRN